MPITSGYEGFGDLGSVMMGGGVDTQRSMMAGAQQRVTLEGAMARAKMDRQKAMERANLREKLPPGPEGDLMAAALLGEVNLNQAASGIGEMQQNQFRQRALDAPQPGMPGYAATTPDLLNQALAGASDKLLGPSNIRLGEQVDSRLSKDRATAGASNARAASSEAQADANHARAERTRKMPLTSGRGGKKSSPEVDGSFSADDAGNDDGPKKRGSTPPPEGSKVRGPDGKIYVVRNGEPVLLR
jgi:hypothetical protein